MHSVGMHWNGALGNIRSGPEGGGWQGPWRSIDAPKGGPGGAGRAGGAPVVDTPPGGVESGVASGAHQSSTLL